VGQTGGAFGESVHVGPQGDRGRQSSPRRSFTVAVHSRKGDTEVAADEAIRPDTTLEVLSKLKAVGGDDATHTAGNAPGVQ